VLSLSLVSLKVNGRSKKGGDVDEHELPPVVSTADVEYGH
jgi:hypothetical protein